MKKIKKKNKKCSVSAVFTSKHKVSGRRIGTKNEVGMKKSIPEETAEAPSRSLAIGKEMELGRREDGSAGRDWLGNVSHNLNRSLHEL